MKRLSIVSLVDYGVSRSCKMYVFNGNACAVTVMINDLSNMLHEVQFSVVFAGSYGWRITFNRPYVTEIRKILPYQQTLFIYFSLFHVTLAVLEGICTPSCIFNAIFKNSLFPWQFQKPTLCNVFQMLSRCAFQLTDFPGHARIMSPMPRRGKQIYRAHSREAKGLKWYQQILISYQISNSKSLLVFLPSSSIFVHCAESTCFQFQYAIS